MKKGGRIVPSTESMGLRPCGKQVEMRGGQWDWSREGGECRGQEQATQGTDWEGGLDFILITVGNHRCV